MIDNLTILLTHVLIVYALLRLLRLPKVDYEPESDVQAYRRSRRRRHRATGDSADDN